MTIRACKSLSPRRPQMGRAARSRARFTPVAALFLTALIPLAAPAHADGTATQPEPQEAGGYHGNYNINYNTILGTGNYTAGNINKVLNTDSGSTNIDSLDSQITTPNGNIGSSNNFDWATGVLAFVPPGASFSGSANITVPGGVNVTGEYDGYGLGFADGIHAYMGNGYRGQPAVTVNNSGTVTGTVKNHDGVAAGLDAFVNYGDLHITNNSYSNFNANANWYTTAVRALCNAQGDIYVNQYGSLNSTSSGGTQGIYANSGWAVGMDLQTSQGNISATNTGGTTGTVNSSVNGSSEACGAYIFASGGSGSSNNGNGNMTFNNSGTFTANGAPNGAVKGVYCGGNGNLVSVTNSGTITANYGGGNGYGYALETEIDGNGTMNITNYGTLTTNASNGLFIVSTTSSDPNSGGTGPVRVENWGTIRGGGAAISSAYYNGPITVYDHGTITGGGGAISLGNSRPDAIYVYGTPSIQGTMSAGPGGSTLTLHVPAPISSISGQHSNTDANLANDGLGTSGSITAGGKTYSWSNLTVSGAFASTSSNIPNGTYVFTNRNSQNVLDEPGGQTGNGTRLEQYQYNGGSNQKWQVTYLGSGLYQIVNVASGRSLDDNGYNTANGAAIDVYDLASPAQTNQEWIFTTTDPGYYTISPADAPGSCLDVQYAGKNNGALVQLYTLADRDTQPTGGTTGGTGQQWSLAKQ